MTAKGIRYFNRFYYLPKPGQAEEAKVALMNLASGAAAGAFIEATLDAKGDFIVQLLVTPGADVVLAYDV